MTEQQCLLRAQVCDDEARKAEDRKIKAERSLLSIEWHFLASDKGRRRVPDVFSK
jgi:hypothetical protein